MDKAYDFARTEKKWYQEWMSRGYFRGDPSSSKEPYTIVIPPPNVTGILTLGHVLNNTLQDILIRTRKMQGFETCWVPGMDHAGIATQARVEAYLRENEQLSRHDLGREKFVERAWQWKEQYGGAIIRQLKRLGVACDWERERFTLDEGLSAAVQEVFVRLHEKGYVYRGHRMINWCPKSQTALSDEEVIHREVQGKLWHFRYPVQDGEGYVIVATTRPETMLGDTAVAVHPEDERFRHLHGGAVILPIMDRTLPVICDTFVQREFGTGAVKVTPAHDPNDYDMGLRHDLEVISVIGDDGTMSEAAGEFAGLDRDECRRRVVQRMEELDLVEKIEDYTHQVGYSERGGVPVEPRLSEQWFVDMKELARPALQAVAEGKIRFHPERWVKTYRHWMENIRDWCISRQLWWGHRIPAYTCDACGEIVVARQAPASCPKCGHAQLTQDEDVLDTWFSSWLWPFSVFEWPEQTVELDRFYPTSSLVTAPDIIFFWVARMIMGGVEFMNEIPFRDVYFTSLIRDDQGRKLSKSLGNSPDPLAVMDEYGADGLRFTIIYLSPLGQDIRYSNDKCELGRNFATKIWNSARFRQAQDRPVHDGADLETLDALRPDDRWILARTAGVIAQMTAALEGFRFHEYARDMYDFVWSEFCDWYIESAKSVFREGDEASTTATFAVFDYVFSVILRLLHPVMPFVTEEIYHELGYAAEGDSIMLAAWPEAMADEALHRIGATAEIVKGVEAKFELIRSVRNIKAEYSIPAYQRVPVVIVPATDDARTILESDPVSLRALIPAEAVELRSDYDPGERSAGGGPREAVAASAVSSLGTAYVPLGGVIDVAAETTRLSKQRDDLTKYIERLEGKLSNAKFTERAPEDVVQAERDRLAEAAEKRDRVDAQLGVLS